MRRINAGGILLLITIFFASPAYSDCSVTGSPNNATGNPLAGCTGVVTISGTLTINANYNVSSLAITSIIVTSTGIVHWPVNADFKIPVNCNFIIQPGGQLTFSGPCNSLKTLSRGPNPLASCNGNNVNYSFAQMMAGGGYTGNNAVTASYNSPLCLGSALQLSCNPTGGVIPYLFSWTGPGGYASTVQNPLIPSPVAGTYTVVVTDVLGVTATANTTVVINPLPSSPSGSGASRCGPGTVTISASTSAGNTVDWYANSTGGIALSVGSFNYITPAISGSTMYYAESRNTTTGCLSSVRTAVTATVNPVPAATISYSGFTYCTTANIQPVSITGQGGGTFSSAPGLSINTSNGEINPSTSSAGNYTVTYSFSNGSCSSSTTTNVTIESAPSATISYSSSSFCTSVTEPQVVILSGSGGGTFSSSNGLIINTTSGSITPSGSLPGSYIVTYTTPAVPGCSTVTATTSIDIFNGAIVNAGTDGSVCYPTAFPLNGTVSPSASINWLSSGNGSFGNTSQLVTTYTPGSADTTNGSVWLILETVSGCYSRDSLLLLVNKIPSIPVINSPRVICTGNSSVISINTIANADSYLWWVQTPGTLASSTGQTNTVNIPASLGTGLSGIYISARASNECGLSDSARFWIRSYISAPTLGGPTSVCAGSTYTYSSRVVTGADSVKWTLPANVSVAHVDSITYNITYGSAFTGGSITINAYFSCQNTSITRNIILVPVRTPSAISGLNTSLCDTTVTFSVTPVPDASGYLWTVPSGVTISGPVNTNSITLTFGSFTSGILSVKSFNPCGLGGGVRSLSIKGSPATPTSISGPATACAQQTGLNYSIPLITGAHQYTWTVPGSASILSGQGTNAVVVKWGNTSGNLSVKANRSCGGTGSARSFAVTVNCRQGEELSDNIFILSPNPSSDYFTVFIKGMEPGRDIMYSIRDLSGRLLSTKKTVSDTLINERFETALPQGIYLLTVESGDYFKIQKFIIE